MDAALTAPRPLWQPQPGNLPQRRAYECDADVIGYGGAGGGGKSQLILGLAVTRHTRSLILRREAVQLEALKDDLRAILGDSGRFNSNTGVWRGLPGGRQVEMKGVANPGDEQKYRGQPHDLLAFDEADQFPEHVVRFLSGWLRSTDPGQPCRMVLCFNPPATAEGRWLLDFFAPWVDERHPRPAGPGEVRYFVRRQDGEEVECPDRTPCRDGNMLLTPKSRTFFPAKVTDNPAWEGTDYIATLQALHEPLRSQLLYGDMQAGLKDDAWQVVPTAWVKAAQQRWRDAGGRPPADQPLSCVGVDVAYGGADQTVVSPRYGPWFGPLKKYKGPATDSGKKAAALVMREYVAGSGAPLNVDAIGYGAPCHESLRDDHGLGKLAVAVNAAERTEWRDRSKKYGMVNVRAAMYWSLREALDPDTGDGLMLPPDPELLGDLTAARYEVRANGIIVEPKERIRERLCRSPDCGDALALAHWHVRKKVFRMMA